MPEKLTPSIPQTAAPELFKGFDKEFKAQQARVTTAQGVVASLAADIGVRGGRLQTAESKQSFIQQAGGLAAAPGGAAAGALTGALLGGAPGAAAGGVIGAAAPTVISTYMKLASLTNQDLFYDKTLIENTAKLRDSLYKMTSLMESEEWRLSVMAYMSRAGLEDLSITGLAGKTNSKGETNPYKPTPEDVDWWNRMVRPRIEESRMRSPSLIRDVEADLASKAKINIVNMDDLTTAEIAEAWRTPATVDISKYGLSNSELRALYTEFGLTEEQQTEAFQEFDDLAQQFIDQWIERSQTLEAFRASVASPEIDVTIGERLMQAYRQSIPSRTIRRFPHRATHLCVRAHLPRQIRHPVHKDAQLVPLWYPGARIRTQVRWPLYRVSADPNSDRQSASHQLHSTGSSDHYTAYKADSHC